MSDPRSDANEFIRMIPQARALGIVVQSIADGVAEISMPWDARLVGDPKSGVIHGGAVFTLLDTASGMAVMSHPEASGPTATLNLRVDYMRAATPGQGIRTRAECYMMTRSVAFVRATAFDDDDSRPVAITTGAFTLDRKTGEQP